MSDLFPNFILTCVPAAGVGGVGTDVCQAAGGSNMQAKLIEGYVLNAEQVQSLTGSLAEADFLLAGKYFSMGFGVVVACWLIAHLAGAVLKGVKEF